MSNFTLYFLEPMVMVVAWWRTLGVLGLGPQSTSLTLHAVHMQSNPLLIHVRNFEKENVQTLGCNIKS
jgi:hypothetical protein